MSSRAARFLALLCFWMALVVKCMGFFPPATPRPCEKDQRVPMISFRPVYCFDRCFFFCCSRRLWVTKPPEGFRGQVNCIPLIHDPWQMRPTFNGCVSSPEVCVLVLVHVWVCASFMQQKCRFGTPLQVENLTNSCFFFVSDNTSYCKPLKCQSWCYA
jgi:hypothetical protein